MSTDSQLILVISDGPSTDQMLDSLKYAFSRQRLNVRFRVNRIGESSFVIEAIIKGVRYESGRSGNLLFDADIITGGTGRIKGYYNSLKREGTFEMVS